MATCAIMFVVLLISTIVNYINPMYLVNYTLRILITSTNHFAANSLWWLIMGKPIYKCMFDRNRYYTYSYGKCGRSVSGSTVCYTNTGSFYEQNTAYANFVLSSKRTSFLNVDAASERAIRISIGDGLCQGQILTDCPDHCIVALNESRLYAPISVPDAAAMPPLKLSAAHVRHLDYYNQSERQLL
ncbi:hypothetical protein BX661DRAFT_184502 [Kickxella alabastrina]|uniref:uncharacterized protein n=1 Tax=Kickxella alabastrina TaxID=61397 RepID=UPI002220F5B5|nr:uncharacterized protein BX661DRAFT_184502 [Kickxella alabastrina]KAI7825419.1 hypothetical protein BX661DRAFT_184502 [Kickxella alabastrina]